MKELNDFKILKREQIINTTKSNDDIGLVIRNHIIIESIFNFLLNQVIKIPKILESMSESFTYHQKLHILIGCDLIDTDLLPHLKALGKLRNDLAHDDEVNIENRINLLYQTFPKDIKGSMNNTFDLVKKDLTENKNSRFTGEEWDKLKNENANFHSMPYRMKFLCIIITLYVELLSFEV